MGILKNILIISFGLTAYTVFGQLSPGPLAKSHSHLEGLSNCLKCHVVGSKVSDQKCLDCHSFLKKRIENNKGYHSAAEVKAKNCAECHSDHHGKEFEMVRFDKNTFDHNLTGYRLEGSHKSIDCRDCHKPDNIVSLEIRKIPDTYMGLRQECLDCHDDYHQSSLDADCLSCHNMDGFKPASEFNHDRTDFPLKGQHNNVACIACHKRTLKNELVYQEFSNISHANCTDCHLDVHQSTLGNSCVSCHSERSFRQLNNNFDHQKTGFNLEGKHRQLDCRSCHTADSPLTNLFQEYVNVEQNNCVHCHEDVHNGKLGTNCLECHTVESFSYQQNSDKFNHNLTNFPLNGAHAFIDCQDCHSASLTDPVAHSSCSSCHKNYHEDSFTEIFIGSDCKKCHSEVSFSPSTFDLNDHRLTNFPLEGAHLATPCIFCHAQHDRWVFKTLETSCVSCHVDIHENYLDQGYYPQSDCTNCHHPASWSTLSFDHGITGYPLEGKHSEIDCRDCHQADNSENLIAASPVFKVSSECRACHQDIHRNQFEGINSETDCSNCHTFYNWDPVHFNHDSTRFILDGAHIELDCAACHYEVNDQEGTYTLYSLNTIECSDCH